MADGPFTAPAKTYRILVLANAAEGREDEFNDWYTNQHIPDILGTPDFVSAQRFKLASVQVKPVPGPHSFMAIYDVVTNDIQAALDKLSVRRAAGQIRPSQSIAGDAIAYVMEPITDPITNKAHPTKQRQP